MRVISWNVNGLRGLLKQSSLGDEKGRKMTALNPLQSLLERHDPDILCLQEIKTATTIDLRSFVPALRGHRLYWNCAQTLRGYSGTLVASRLKPIGVRYNLPADIVAKCDREYGTSTRFNQEGRLIALYFEDFTLLNVYSPNAGFGLKRLDEKIGWWERAFRLYVERLQTGIRIDPEGAQTPVKRDVIVVGDLNVIPDLKLDRRALQYQDGATDEERKSFHALLRECKLTDSFRHLHPKHSLWTWVPPKLWDRHFMGCRIDFVLVDEASIGKVKESIVLVYRGSDHRPILAEIDV